eukprot:2109893-Alexandrium_andersonii.AAC.1
MLPRLPISIAMPPRVIDLGAVRRSPSEEVDVDLIVFFEGVAHEQHGVDKPEEPTREEQLRSGVASSHGLHVPNDEHSAVACLAGPAVVAIPRAAVDPPAVRAHPNDDGVPLAIPGVLPALPSRSGS